MLIELWRKVLATDYSITNCGVCGNDFDRGTDFPVAFTDNGEEIGEVCPACLDYLNRRREDADDPTLAELARDWLTPEDLKEARRRYPEAMFPDSAAYEEAAPGWDEQEEVAEASILWRMEREGRG